MNRVDNDPSSLRRSDALTTNGVQRYTKHLKFIQLLTGYFKITSSGCLQIPAVVDLRICIGLWVQLCVQFKAQSVVCIGYIPYGKGCLCVWQTSTSVPRRRFIDHWVYTSRLCFRKSPTWPSSGNPENKTVSQSWRPATWRKNPVWDLLQTGRVWRLCQTKKVNATVNAVSRNWRPQRSVKSLSRSSTITLGGCLLRLKYWLVFRRQYAQEKHPKILWGQNGTATDPEGTMIFPLVLDLLYKCL